MLFVWTMCRACRLVLLGFVVILFLLFPAKDNRLLAVGYQETYADLELTSISVDAQHVPTFTIKNIGTKETNLTTTQGQGVKLTYTWKGEAEFGPYTIDLRDAIGILYINETKTVKGQPPPYVSSRPHINQIVGQISTEYFVDINSNNNTRTQSVTPFIVENQEVLPDLSIESVTFHPDTLAPTVTVRNIGWGRAYLGANNDTYVRLNYSWLTESGATVGQNTPPLATSGRYLAYNETAVVTLPAPPDRRQIYRRFFVDVDIPSKVQETDDEGNNRRSVPVEEADLQISGVSYNSVSRQPMITISNAGRAQAILGPAKLFYQYLSQTSTELLAGTLAINQASGQTTIPGNGSILLTLPVPGDNAYTLKALVDSNNDIVEKYEDNNRYEGNFPELAPDIIIDWISFQPRGTVVDILLGLKNIGKKFCTISNSGTFHLSWRNAHEDEIGNQDIPASATTGSAGSIYPNQTKQVTLTNITPADNSVQLFATVHPGCSEPDGNNTTHEYTPWNTLPDLIISSGGFNRAHAISPYFITVKNDGVANAQLYQKDNIEQTRAQITMGWQNVLGHELTRQTQGIGSQEDILGIEKTISNDLFLDPPPADAFYLYAIVDEPGNHIPELNEGNNTFRLIANLPNEVTLLHETQASAAADSLIDTFNLESLRKQKDATKSAWFYKPLNIDFTKIEENMRSSAENKVQDFFEALNPRRKDKIRNREKRAAIDLLKAKGFLEKGEIGLAENRLKHYEDNLTKAGMFLSDLQKNNPTDAGAAAGDFVDQQLKETLVLNALQGTGTVGLVVAQAQNKVQEQLSQALSGAGKEGGKKIFQRTLTQNPSPLVAIQNKHTLNGMKTKLPPDIQSALTEEEPSLMVNLKGFQKGQPLRARKFLSDYIKTVSREEAPQLISALDLTNVDEQLRKNATNPRGEADPLPSPSFPTDGTENWQNFLSPETIRQLEESFGPLVGQIRTLCGKIPQTEAEAHACAQKILGGSFAIPQGDTTSPQWAVPTEERVNE